MESNTLVTVALVGLALVCGGLVIVAAVLVVRRMLGRAVDMAVDEGGVRRRGVAPKPDLRAIAQAQDFDAALARQGEKQAAHNRLPPVADFPDAPPALGSRSKTRRFPNPINDESEEDDALADFMDDV